MKFGGYVFGAVLCLWAAAASAQQQQQQIQPPLSQAQPAAEASAQGPQLAQTPPLAQGYVLGPADVIEVGILGRADFSARAQIAVDGTVQLPYLGSVQAANKTVAQLREQLVQALEKGGYFSKPILNINIVSYASRYVTVLGSVGTPGLVPVDRSYHLSELLARVGGVRGDAADYLIVRSPDGPVHRLSIRSLATGDPSEDPFVAPGDKIFAPQVEFFYISGQIKAPGAYPLLTGMTYRMAISKSGGLTDQGSMKKIKVNRHGKEVGHIDLDTKVEPDDVIVIGERLF